MIMDHVFLDKSVVKSVESKSDSPTVVPMDIMPATTAILVFFIMIPQVELRYSWFPIISRFFRKPVLTPI